MNYRDLQELKQRIHIVGKNIREQEIFYSDINEFLHRVYQKKSTKHKRTSNPNFA